MSEDEARGFAEAAHAGQFRKGAAREPYFVHLQEVAALVAGAGAGPEVIRTAWLHDTVEDCEVSLDDLRQRFGPQVAAMVAELTDDKTLPKSVRKRLQVIRAPHKSAGAALVKIADKLSNIRALALSPPEDWSLARLHGSIDWGAEVVAALPSGADPLRPAFAAQLVASRAAVGGRAG